MTYYAVYDSTTGDLISTGTEVADDEVLAERGYAKVSLAGGGPPADKLWNPETKEFDVPAPQVVPPEPADPTVPAPDVEELLESDPEFAGLSATNKTLVRVITRALDARGRP